MGLMKELQTDADGHISAEQFLTFCSRASEVRDDDARRRLGFARVASDRAPRRTRPLPMLGCALTTCC